MFKKLRTWFGSQPTDRQQADKAIEAKVRAQCVKDLTAILAEVNGRLVALETGNKLSAGLLDVVSRKLERLDVIRDAMNRVCEMAMVAAGHTAAATQFRQTAAAVERGSSWMDPQPEPETDQWPPPGCTEVVSRG